MRIILFLVACVSPALAMPDAPVRLSIEGRAEGPLHHVTLRIERASPNAVPLRVQVALPDGAKLVTGALEETIVDPEAKVVERTVTVRAETVPSGDLVVLIEADGANYGVRGEQRYRFGRAAPVVRPVPRMAPVGRAGTRAVPGSVVDKR